MRWLRKNRVTLILIAALAAGVILLLYPVFSDYWNRYHQSRAIAGYAETVADISDDAYERILQSAREYNARLAETGIQWVLNEQQTAAYEAELDIDGTGIMSYIEIPKIDCSLPVYHGVDEASLQIAIGHIPGTSLPVGGAGTHCVLSGHRGLPSARLFTDLVEMEEGDVFVIRTLDETLTYEVDQIRIVLPTELGVVQIEPGEDYCTLVTCTPYGVNTHRILVRGHRIENAREAAEIRVTADAMQINEKIVALFLALPVLIVLFLIRTVSLPVGKKKKKQK